MDRTAAANYALLVMYAWDMCDGHLRDISPPPVDHRIIDSGLTVVGFLKASDDIVGSGNRIRSAVMGSSTDNQHSVYYGYVAQQQDGQFVVVIRGTDGAEEWADDLDFLMTKHSIAQGGLVDQGFWSIYRTMQFIPTGNGTAATAAVGIKNLVGSMPVMVLGHSLGAAIATYLTLDLKVAGCDASTCLFASPRTGNKQFVDYFESQVTNYDLFNYERDVVPKVPKYDILHFSRYYDLSQAKTIPADDADATINDDPTCNHHLICYVALLNSAIYRTARARFLSGSDDVKCSNCVLETSA